MAGIGKERQTTSVSRERNVSTENQKFTELALKASETQYCGSCDLMLTYKEEQAVRV